MNKRTIESELINYLEGVRYNDLAEPLGLPGLKKVRSYSDIGMLTNDNGLVLTFKSGETFQITIKRGN